MKNHRYLTKLEYYRTFNNAYKQVVFNYMKDLFCIVIVLFSTCLFAQTEEDNLKRDMLTAIKAVNRSDHEELLKYIPDFVFENISKEEMLKILSNDTKSNISEDTEIRIDTILTIDSVKYAKFYYLDVTPTYGVKKQSNSNWTFADLNEMTEKYIPKKIQSFEKKN